VTPVTVSRTPAGNSELLREQYTLLRDSVSDFYNGESPRAIDIAVRLRTLVHQPEPRPGQVPSRPFLSFMDAGYSKLSIFHKMPDRCSPPTGTVVAIYQGVRLTGGSAPKFFRDDFSSPSYGLVPLERWWTEEYLALVSVRSSKKQITLDIANKDGGAHVDADVPARHAVASEPPVVFGVNGQFVRLNLARGTVAQAGNELLECLEYHFREILKDLLPAPTMQTIKQVAIRAGFRPMPVTDSIRALFTRTKNFLNVHTDGKWAFYTELRDGKKPDHWGHDFESLLMFLNSPA
jgi:hypothetical protein